MGGVGVELVIGKDGLLWIFLSIIFRVSVYVRVLMYYFI